MKLINKNLIIEFYEKNRDSKVALERWVNLIEQINCHSWHELKQIFNSVDNVGNDHYVFNIKGNNYRLIAVIFFQLQTVNIRKICNHNDYDNIKPKPKAISEL